MDRHTELACRADPGSTRVLLGTAISSARQRARADARTVRQRRQAASEDQKRLRWPGEAARVFKKYVVVRLVETYPQLR